MVKTYHAVAIGHISGIYTTWSHASTQVNEFSGSCHAGFNDLDSAVRFMTVNGDHNEENIKVFGIRGGQYTLRE